MSVRPANEPVCSSMQRRMSGPCVFFDQKDWRQQRFAKIPNDDLELPLPEG